MVFFPCCSNIIAPVDCYDFPKDDDAVEVLRILRANDDEDLK